MENDGIAIYTSQDGSVSLEVKSDTDTVWLTQAQIVELFDSSLTNINDHIINIYAEGELDKESTIRKFRIVQQEGNRKVKREVLHYNLDVILSVGYRVKSKVATEFRKWATEQLKSYLVQGYAINQERLNQLGQMIQILGRADDELVSGVAEVLSGYIPSLDTLRSYDDGSIAAKPNTEPAWTLTIGEARDVIGDLSKQYPQDTLLGKERGDSLEGIVNSIYQGFGGQDLYATVEEKAANLLYLVIKDHPLADGNKRTAAALFVTFLAKNNILHDNTGSTRIANNALAAITLMVAMSDPKEKDLMVTLLMNMISM